MSIDKFTNTDSFEELCKKIVDANKYATYIKSTPKQSNLQSESDVKMCDDTDYNKAKCSVISELSVTLEKKNSSDESTARELSIDRINKHCAKDMNVTVTIGSLNEKFIAVEEGSESPDINSELPTEYCHNRNSPDCDYDCASLPDPNSQNDFANKSLKRWQAFPALQV
jgi:hypothetical protein